MRNLTIATIITLLATTFAHSSNLSYELKIINKDKTVHCDLLYIIGDDLRCRQGRGTILYSYSSAEKIAVESNGKVFTFEKELSTEKEQLATAFRNISDKEYNRLRGIYEQKRKYLAKKRQEELERQQALASQSPTYSGQPRQSSNRPSYCDKPIAQPKLNTFGDIVNFKAKLAARRAACGGNSATATNKKAGYMTRDAHGNIVNSNINHQTKDVHGNIVNSNSNYQTKDVHGNIVNSNSNYQTRDAHGNIVNSQQ